MQNNDSSSQQEQNSLPGLSRRDLLLGLGAAATVVCAAPAIAAMPGHDHSKHSAQQTGTLEATNDCLDKGQRCIAHCLVSFQEGDLQLADCASKVHEMHAVCGAFSYLLAANSAYSRDYAAICARVCEDCEKECRKHKEHVECSNCADACAAVIDQIKLEFA